MDGKKKVVGATVANPEPRANNRNRNRNRRRGRGNGSAPSSRKNSIEKTAAPDANKRNHTAPPAHNNNDNENTTNVPNPFAFRFGNSRIRERCRTFVVGGQPFIVAERTIGGIDDIVYRKERDAWEHLPRGNANVFIPRASSPTHQPRTSLGSEGSPGYVKVGALNGLRKFGYDDSDYGYPDRVVTAYAMEKENGECGHLAAFCLKPTNASDAAAAAAPVRYWFLGSKKVHIVFRYDMPDEDFALYTGMRYQYALKIARLWREMIQRHAISPTDLEAFHDALSQNNWTACFEAIFADSQHLVDYHGANEFRFFGLAMNDTPSEKGLCLDVPEAHRLFQSWGLPFCHYSEKLDVKSTAYAELLEKIARQSNSEGCVMYGYDANGLPVRLWKEKSYPYVMERFTREAITTHKLAGKPLAHKIERRLATQPRDLRQYFEEWERDRMPWLVEFAAWLQMTKEVRPHMSRDDAFVVRNKWLDLQRDFAAATAQDPEMMALCDRYHPEAVEWGEHTQLDVIKFVGPQGCGKSTLSRALFVLLTEAGYRPRWVNQDEAGNRNNYLAAIRKATNPSEGVTHLFLDKMNLDQRTNRDYGDLPIAVTVAFDHPEGAGKMLDECFRRVVERGCGHRTIRLPDNLTPDERAAEKQKIRKFMAQALRSCEVPDDDTVVELELTASPQEMLRSIWGKLSESGFHELPPLDTLDVEAALRLAQEYEPLLSALPKAPIYGAIVVKNPQDILKLVPPNLLEGQIPQSQFHVTTKYFVGDMNPIYFSKLAHLLDQEIELTLLRVVADARGVAILVRREGEEFPCENAYAHITVANQKGTPPRYSNELIIKAEEGEREGGASPTVVPLPPNTTVRGVFAFR